MKKSVSVILCIVLLVIGGGLLFRNHAINDVQHERRVVDSLDRVVMIPERPKRIVMLNASNLELFYAVGGADLIVGKPTSQALSDEIQLATQNAAEIGVIHSPDIEKILELKPDLVVGVNVPFHHSLIPILEAANIPLLVKSLDTYEEVIDTLAFYGELIGQETRATEQIASVKSKYEAALALSQGKVAPSNLMIWGSAESFSMATGQSFVGDLVNRLGGNNIADALGKDAGSFVPVCMEYIAKTNPEVIFLITHSSDEKVNQKFRQELNQHPAWQGIRAVQNNRVYTLPYQLFAVNPGTRVAEAMEILANRLYADGGNP